MSQINVDNIRNRLGGAIGAPSGIVVTGVSTFSGDVSIGGTLTYEDVTNIDSVGVITARSGLVIGGDANNGVAEGFKLDANGLMQVSRGDGVSALFAGYTQGSSTQTSRINNNGNAYFLGNVGVGTNSPTLPSGTGLEIHHATVPRLKFSNSTTGSAGGDGFQIYGFGSDAHLENKEAGNIIFYTSGTEKVRVTSDGFVSMGVASPAGGAQLTVAGKGIAITGQNTDHSANSMRLGEEGSGLAQIRCYGPDASTNGSLDLVSSRDGGSNSLKVSLLSNGNLSISDGNLVVASGHGIDFSATSGSGTSELLDDYEEGTWTPANQYLTITNNSQAHYVKIGKLVTVWFDCTYNSSPADSSQTGGLIEGLPFSSDSDKYFDISYLLVDSSNAELSFATSASVHNASRIEIRRPDSDRICLRNEMDGNHIMGCFTYQSS
jgi:hypothetical protein